MSRSTFQVSQKVEKEIRYAVIELLEGSEIKVHADVVLDYVSQRISVPLTTRLERYILRVAKQYS